MAKLSEELAERSLSHLVETPVEVCDLLRAKVWREISVASTVPRRLPMRSSISMQGEKAQVATRCEA
jgi:hypothetical protein